jgi:hypothetical protein
MSIFHYAGKKIISSHLLTKKIDMGIRRIVKPKEEIWERYIEERPDNAVYIVGDVMYAHPSIVDALKETVKPVIYGFVPGEFIS